MHLPSPEALGTASTNQPGTRRSQRGTCSRTAVKNPKMRIPQISNHHDSTPGFGSSLWMSTLMVCPRKWKWLGNQVTDPPIGGLTLLLPPTTTYLLLPPTTSYNLLLPPTTPKTDPVRPLLGTSQAAEVLVTRTPAAPLAVNRRQPNAGAAVF